MSEVHLELNDEGLSVRKTIIDASGGEYDVPVVHLPSGPPVSFKGLVFGDPNRTAFDR